MGDEEDPEQETEQLSEQPQNHRENSEQNGLNVNLEKGEHSDLSERIENGDISIEDISGGYVPRNVQAKTQEGEEATQEADEE